MSATNRFNGGLTRKQFLAGAAALTAAAAGGAFGLLGPTRSARAATLVERAVPSSGEKIPIIGLGTARVYDVEAGDPKLPELKATVETFVREGGKVIDCSPTYGNAEAVVGRFINELDARNKVFYATKISTNGEKEGLDQVNASLKQWNTDRFDLLQVHNMRDFGTQIRTIRRLKDEGKVRYVGVTTSSQRSYDRFVALLKSEKLDFVQVNYSLMQPESGDRVLPAAKDAGLAVLINRPFALAGTFRKVKGRKLPEWAAEFGDRTWAQFFLKFVVGHPAVTCAIPGTDKPEYMTDNLGAAMGPIPDEKTRARMLAFWKTL
ncbi:MAG: aldo/keto reductase [Alphaproteobacteria bacterium]|nr:aldo/keto reductase [Alphaproteobacteria bacterium]